MSQSSSPRPHLILASTSRYRRALLEEAGFTFTCIAPVCDEAAEQSRGLPPRDLALRLAELKARSVAERHPDAVVLGSDQVLALGERVFNKPGTVARACAQLAELSGRTHEVITALCVCCSGTIVTHVETAAMTVRALSASDIAAYIEADQPLDCAGSYKLESRGRALFERIECADTSTIVGLPLQSTTRILSSYGIVPSR